MSGRAVKSVLLVLVSAWLAAVFPPPFSTSRAADAPPSGVASDVVDALGRMSKTLAAKQFSFTSRTLRAYAGPNGELLHIAHATKILIRRPDKVSADIAGDDGTVELRYDGQNLVLYAVEQKQYATTPAPGGIDKALDALEAQTKVDFPLADLLGDDPGKSLLEDVTSGGQVGTATIGGTPCRHYFFVQAGEDLEWELWLEDNDRALPRRVVITYRSLPGLPRFLAELSDWNFSPTVADGDFTFKPPPGVTQVELTAAGKPAPPSK
jgi:hypothetical protein